MRTMTWWATVICVVSIGGDDPKSTSRPIPMEQVPDPRWQPTVGDQVVTKMEGLPAARTYRAFGDFATFAEAGDRAGIDEAYRSGDVLKLDRNTKILVLKDYAAPRSTTPSTISSGSLSRSMLTVAPDTRSTKEPVEVRILDGPHADKLVFVSRRDIAKTYERRVLANVKIGDRATVAEPNTLLSKSTDALYLYRWAVVDGDRVAASNVVRSGNAARIDGGVKAQVLAVDGEFCRVKVLGSKLAGTTGFVSRGDLIPPAPPTNR